MHKEQPLRNACPMLLCRRNRTCTWTTTVTFLGDTIWYKAYLVEAASLRPTAESHILYVELVDPEGHVVERHRQYIGRPDADHGDFALADTLRSGYYELRAYTRWMMNFCVTERPYNRKDRELFYNRQMAKDFFRDYGTV